MAELLNMASQFRGLPMGDLIGAPIKAACDAQVMLAHSTASFIDTVGIERDDKGVSKGPRQVKFQYKRLVENPLYDSTKADSEPFVTQDVEINVPLLAIVPIPNLGIDTLDVTFDMEVKSAVTDKSSFEATAGAKIEGHIGGGWWGASVEISGSVTSKSENTRTSDNSARYHVAVHAKDKGTPEGLSRVLDMLHQSIVPNVIRETATTPTP
ncbi:hypothetical protein CBW65_16165 [Tumebacillus avium]|uniref:DUF2589 domain-containing protein n=1 Tax=Tumebacillus avium TaxID=1903704 RepID=A0A1Y0IPU5_9BACL|nr:DUF2589 domain-containing protein [Tumebacillus avium]ARU62330.1 hypothetical protein CBW65_16165 [Tumebacillus avium]